MEIQEKLKILKSLDTKSLIAKLTEYEGELLQALTQQADFTAQSSEYISSRGSDCAKVKEIIAELIWGAPATSAAGQKTTVAERENWLYQQRRENKELADAIARQREVAFLQDDFQIKCEMAKRRLEGVKAILGLKTAQINFLAGD